MNSKMHNHLGRRLGLERRKMTYDIHVPERRSGGDRRINLDRRDKDKKHLRERIRDFFRLGCEVVRRVSIADKMNNPAIPRAAYVRARQAECRRTPQSGQILLRGA
jgi:hypothetical protein